MTPTGNTQYGTPRTFEATVINVQTSSSTPGYTGNVTFVDGNGQTLCTTPAVNNANLVGATVRHITE